MLHLGGARLPLPTRRHATAGQIIRVGDIEFDRAHCLVRRFGRERPIVGVECRILDLLMGNLGTVFSRVQILTYAWGPSAGIDERTVDAYISRVRKRINRPGAPDPIRSLRGLGYMFDEAFAIRCHKEPAKVHLKHGAADPPAWKSFGGLLQRATIRRGRR